MRIYVLVFLLIPLMSFGTVWSKTGHRVTGHIAEKHLTRKAKKAIKDLFNGHSLAYASTYADEIKADRSYAKYAAWHYVNYPLGSRYEQSEKSQYGDLVAAIEMCTTVLKDKTSSRSDKVFYLKLLIHFIGDLHQPMHAGIAKDKGGNDIQIQWFDMGTNLHRLWDTNLIDSYGMNFYELGDELDRSITKKQRKEIQEGTLYDWVDESHQLAAKIYDSVHVGEKLGYSYSYEYNPILFSQLQKGGFRLAKVLNDIFG